MYRTNYDRQKRSVLQTMSVMNGVIITLCVLGIPYKQSMAIIMHNCKSVIHKFTRMQLGKRSEVTIIKQKMALIIIIFSMVPFYHQNPVRQADVTGEIQHANRG